MRNRFAAATLAALVTASCREVRPDGPLGRIRPQVPSVMAAYQAQARSAFQGERARGLVAYMDQYVRLPGNTGFDASVAEVVGELRAAGYRNEDEGAAGPLTYRIERRPLRRPTWEPTSASVRIVRTDAPLLRFETNRNVVAINSFSTPAGGVEAEVVDVGAGAAEDFSGKDVRGKIVFGEQRVGRLFTEAVQNRGALGVIAYSIPALNRPEEHRDIISYASIPQDTAARSWGLQLTTNARDELRAALGEGPVRVHVEVAARLFDSEELTLVAEVRGATRPGERFVFSAHVQEAGANDNASGVAALAEMARVFAAGVQAGTFVPARTITMIWGDEISSTRRYLDEDSSRTAGVRWGMSLDMVGEDTEKTGGTFLIEKMPDPSAVWTRGEDRHTEWGGQPLTVDRLTPHYFNDFVLNRCLDRAEGTGWVVRTNPFEGGSDHVPFLRAGKPGLLLWHFTDVFYHTDRDRIEMVSAATLKNVGVCAAVSAMTLTSADGWTARFVIDELERSAIARLHAEAELSRAEIASGMDAEEQRRIVRTWTDWYEAAIRTASDVETGGASAETTAAIDAAAARVRATGAELIRSLVLR